MLVEPDKSKFTVLQTNLSMNNKLNQIFSYASHTFNDSSLGHLSRKLLSQISFIFDSEYVEPKVHPGLRFSFNRLNERYEVPYNYALLFKKSSPISGKEVKLKTNMFLFNMNELFEKFLSILLK